LETIVRDQNPAVNAASMSQLRAQLESFVASGIADAMSDTPEVYARYFTAGEMKEIVAFYQTPTGMKALQVAPKATVELFESAMPRIEQTKDKIYVAFLDALQQQGYRIP
jgi:uncharacterized protein